MESAAEIRNVLLQYSGVFDRLWNKCARLKGIGLELGFYPTLNGEALVEGSDLSADLSTPPILIFRQKRNSGSCPSTIVGFT